MLAFDTLHISHPIVIVTGPTTSGKTAYAVQLAEHVIKERQQNVIIINADSQQIYADLPILTAQPTRKEQRGVPHRLFGFWPGDVQYDAARWLEDVQNEINAAHAEGAMPMLVGGTGLYINALTKGLVQVPDIAAEIREAVRSLSAEQAFASLQKEDVAMAEKLKPNDTQRIYRALEVLRSTGKSLLAWQAEPTKPAYDTAQCYTILLQPDRQEMYDRANKRVYAMLEEGLLEEVEATLKKYPYDGTPAAAIHTVHGFRAFADYLQQKHSLEEAINITQTDTRHYIKRQTTWFTHQLQADEII